MKRFVFLIMVLGVILTSCNDDDDSYSLDDWYATIANVEGDYPDFSLVTDAGTVLYPSATAVSTQDFEDGDRMFLYFTILGDGTENSGIDHYIKINNYQGILTKDIIDLTEEIADSIGNDPIWFSNSDEDVWIANDYLNVSFAYEGSPYYLHYINLVSDVNNPTNEDGIPVYEIRHNANDDPYTSPALGAFVSFRLDDLKVDDESSVTFIVKSIGRTESENFEKTFTYEYDTEETIEESASTLNFDGIKPSIK